MKARTALFVVFAFVISAASAAAAGLAGKWNCTFDSQIGVQKYVFEFSESDGHLVGTATFERSTGNGKTELIEIKEAEGKVSFVEPFSMNGYDIRIAYSGTIDAKEMKLKREVGDFAVEQIVATRVE